MRDTTKGVLIGVLTSALMFSCLGPYITHGQDIAFLGAPGTANVVKIITAGTCGAGWAELTAVNGRDLIGTLAANGDAGTTGGSDTITPTVATLTAAAQTFTGSAATSSAVSAGTPSGTNNAPAIAWPAGVPTFSGTPFTSVINHTHGVTVTYDVQGGTTAATTGTHVMTSTATGGSVRAPTSGDVVSATTANPSGGVSSITPAGTVAWPAGVPTQSAATFTGSALGTHTHTLTATGTNGASTVTGTLNSFDNRSAWVKVIFCVKT
jgi:hypothetical protein